MTQDKTEAEDGDYNYICNKLPNSWDLRSGWARDLVWKMRNLAKEEQLKLHKGAN